MKNVFLLAYAWGSTVLFGALIFWLATIPGLEVTSGPTNEAIKVAYRMILYSIFFILFYRSIIMSIKSTVGRLSKWRSKREENEDAEFVLIIETLVVIITILATSIFALVDETLQLNLPGRNFEIKDVLISVMSIFLTSIIVYTMPVIGELEVAIKHKFFKS